MMKRKRFFPISLALVLCGTLSFTPCLGQTLKQEETSMESNIKAPMPNEPIRNSTVSGRKSLALTLSVSRGGKNLDHMLEIAAKHKVKLTILASSEWAEKHPEKVREMRNAGHEIGSHGRAHRCYTDLGKGDLQQMRELARQEMKASADTLGGISGEKPSLIRLPHCSGSPLTEIAREEGMITIGADAHPISVKRFATKEEIHRDLTEAAQPGGILALAASDNFPEAAEAFEGVVEKLLEEGYFFDTVSTLLEKATDFNKETVFKTLIPRGL